MNELISLTNAEGIVMAVQDANRDIYAGLELLEKAKLRLENTLGQYGGDYFDEYHQRELINEKWRERTEEDPSQDQGQRMGVYCRQNPIENGLIQQKD